MSEDLSDLPRAIESLLARSKAMPAELYRKHIFQTRITETLKQWGFKDRFQSEQEMHRLQRSTFESMRERLAGVGAVVALVGERGLGKTTIVAQFAIEHAWKNYYQSLRTDGPLRINHVIYRKAARLIARYKPMYADFGSTEIEVLEESLKYLTEQQEFLVIDEVHDCDDQKMKTRVLTDLIDRRYAARRDTILIANQTSEDFASTIGDSILSRLGEHGAILPCEWPSFRTP